MEKSLLKLFNAVQINSKSNKNFDLSVLKRTIQNGYVLDPSIVPTEKALNLIEEIVGISGEKANASFHKSWSVVRDSNIEDLVIQQIIHYITTYGFEAWGLYSDETVYIPSEILEVPGITNKISLTFIKALTSKEVLENIIVLGSKIALSKDTLKEIMNIVKYNAYHNSFVDSIGNRELKTMLYDYYDILPSNSVEYLRYVINKLTQESLLIKNKYLITKIKQSDAKLLDKYILQAPENLASIFFRYKPLFLAMKSISKNKTFFNQLRKKANVLHSPLLVDYMNNVTAQIKNGTFNFSEFDDRLRDTSIYRKIRLAYALNFRLQKSKSIMYKVRNGKGWVTNFEWNAKYSSTINALNHVLDSIGYEISKNIEGKTIYIPENIHYALPTTEKQFIGGLPSNSYVVIPNDIVVGIHWTDVDQNRIDLDFSMIDTKKYGWDSYYRSFDREIMFSGDNTSAPKPNGASELYYLKSGQEDPKLLTINYYNFDSDIEVPCKVFVAHEQASVMDRNYMVDPNNIILSTNILINQKQTVLGLLININEENKLYFSTSSVGNTISSKVGDLTEKSREYLINSSLHPIDLHEVLFRGGATVVSEKPQEGEYIDLSPESLNKNSIIQLFQ